MADLLFGTIQKTREYYEFCREQERTRLRYLADNALPNNFKSFGLIDGEEITLENFDSQWDLIIRRETGELTPEEIAVWPRFKA